MYKTLLIGIAAAASFVFVYRLVEVLKHRRSLKHLQPKTAHLHISTAYKKRCLEQVPQLLDMLVLGLSAGLSFDASLEMYCQRIHNELSSELKGALCSWQIGIKTRSDALLDVAERLELRVLKRFARAVVESLELGHPLAALLEEQSLLLRDELRAHISEEIEKIPVKMLIPMGLLIVPAMLLSILGSLLAGALKFGF